MSYEFADGYKIRDQKGLYFMTFTVDGWIDLFSRRTYRDIFLKNMTYCRENKDLSVGAYVIMTDHAHIIWQSRLGRLSDTVRDFKSYCTKQFIEVVEQGGESRRCFAIMPPKRTGTRNLKYGQMKIMQKKLPHMSFY